MATINVCGVDSTYCNCTSAGASAELDKSEYVSPHYSLLEYLLSPYGHGGREHIVWNDRIAGNLCTTVGGLAVVGHCWWLN